MASLVLSVVYTTHRRRKHWLYEHHPLAAASPPGCSGLQRIGDAGVTVILLGQALALAMLCKSNVDGAYLGGGFEWRTASYVTGNGWRAGVLSPNGPTR
jgi:hypothetical protein